MAWLMVAKLGEQPSMIQVPQRAVAYEIARRRRLGYLAVTVEEWEDNGGDFFPPPSTSDRLAHVLTDSGRGGK